VANQCKQSAAQKQLAGIYYRLQGGRKHIAAVKMDFKNFSPLKICMVDALTILGFHLTFHFSYKKQFLIDFFIF
jgi:hypothetical protein